ncbi:MAG: glycosyltransferase family A protein, partial [Candidatus Electrothrix sp.]
DDVFMRSTKDDFRVIALIAAYNEADIISSVIEHLINNGIEVYLIDNRSTDDTVEQASPFLGKGLINIETYPPSHSCSDEPNGVYDWSSILRRKEELAVELEADWFIHHDADEFREGPFPSLTLKKAIRYVDSLGYNCIDFHLLNFHPVNNDFIPGTDPRSVFTRYEDGADFDAVQRKCWKSTGTPVSLVHAGGHDVQFYGRRVSPIKFILCHIPIRSQQHGIRKVFQERKNRFVESERAKGWHVQYDEMVDAEYSFLKDREQLVPFDLEQVRLRLLTGAWEINLQDPLFRRLLSREEELAHLLQSNYEQELEIGCRLGPIVERRKEELEQLRNKLGNEGSGQN